MTLSFVRWTLPVFALLALSWPASASKSRWESVLLNEQGLFYIDPQTIKNEGERMEVLSLLDYKKTQISAAGKPYLSIEALIRINCRQKMARIIHLTYYKGNMLAGGVVERQGMLQDWHDIENGTPIQRIAKRIC